MEHYFTNNSHLKSEIRTISYENKGIVFTFFSDLGVFSKDKIDYGSRVLVETIIQQGKKYNNILDVGCGYGFIGIVLGKLNEASVVFTDVNKRALHLCERNIKENKIKGEIVLSNAYENITETYDLIVTNPPIRAGKEVVLNIIRDARKHLKEDGELWFVIRKDKGVKSVIKCVEDIYKTEVVKKDKGFYIVRAKIY